MAAVDESPADSQDFEDDPYQVYMLRRPAERASSVVPQLPKQPEMAETRLRYRRISPEGDSGSLGSLGNQFPPRFEFPNRRSLLESLTSDDESSSFAVRRKKPTEKKKKKKKRASRSALAAAAVADVVSRRHSFSARVPPLNLSNVDEVGFASESSTPLSTSPTTPVPGSPIGHGNLALPPDLAEAAEASLEAELFMRRNLEAEESYASETHESEPMLRRKMSGIDKLIRVDSGLLKRKDSGPIKRKESGKGKKKDSAMKRKGSPAKLKRQDSGGKIKHQDSDDEDSGTGKVKETGFLRRNKSGLLPRNDSGRRRSLEMGRRKSMESSRKSLEAVRKSMEPTRKSMDNTRKSMDSARRSLDFGGWRSKRVDSATELAMEPERAKQADVNYPGPTDSGRRQDLQEELKDPAREDMKKHVRIDVGEEAVKAEEFITSVDGRRICAPAAMSPAMRANFVLKVEQPVQVRGEKKKKSSKKKKSKDEHRRRMIDDRHEEMFARDRELSVSFAHRRYTAEEAAARQLSAVQKLWQVLAHARMGGGRRSKRF